MIYKYNDKFIIISEYVVKRINSYKQLKRENNESGGILLGKVFDDVIYIDSISEPSSDDESGRLFFYRNVEKAQNIVEIAWKESNGERIYLGEWHTHPERNPKPSTDDQNLISSMLKHSKMEIDFLIMIIAGMKNMYVGIQKQSRRLSQLYRLHHTECVKVEVYYKNKNISGFQVIGYINYAKTGYDIYNAALSTICIGTLKSILDLVPLESYMFISTCGFIKFLLPHAVEQEQYRDIKLLLDAMLLQLNFLNCELKRKTNLSVIIGSKTLEV